MEVEGKLDCDKSCLESLTLFKSLDVKEITDDNYFKFKKRFTTELKQDYRNFIGELVPFTTELTKCQIYEDENTRYIIAYKSPPIDIQYGKRKLVAIQDPEIIDYCNINSDITNSHPNTWPSELYLWWMRLQDFTQVKKVINNLKKYYHEDSDLNQISDWLEEMITKDPDIRFKISYRLEIPKYTN
jgi:hypothetical protein